MGNGGVNLVGSEEILLEEGLQEDAAHFAGSEDGYADVGKLGRRFDYRNGDFGHGWLPLASISNARMMLESLLFRIPFQRGI